MDPVTVRGFVILGLVNFRFNGLPIRKTKNKCDEYHGMASVGSLFLQLLTSVGGNGKCPKKSQNVAKAELRPNLGILTFLFNSNEKTTTTPIFFALLSRYLPRKDFFHLFMLSKQASRQFQCFIWFLKRHQMRGKLNLRTLNLFLSVRSNVVMQQLADQTTWHADIRRQTLNTLMTCDAFEEDFAAALF